MKICKEKDSRPLFYVDLNEGDVFRFVGDGSFGPMLVTDENPVELESGEVCIVCKDDDEVILYPNACVKLGEPSE